MRYAVLLLTLVIVLTACGGGEAQPTATQVSAPPTAAPTQPPTAQPTEPPTPTQPEVEPTSQPAPSATQPTTEPAPGATEPAAQPTPLPTATPTPAPATGGTASFRNSLAVADQLVLKMNGVAPPPAGFAYEGWLIADDGVTEISTGVFQVGADGSVDYTWTSPAGENLIARYASFAVTVEPASDSDPAPASQVVWRGGADPNTLAAARRVFAANDGEPATPRNIAYGQGLLAQSQVAHDHIFNAFNAAAIGAFGEMRTHAEHVINIIAGTASPRFADYTGDGRADNPGDGFGALAYAQQIAALLPQVSGDLSGVENLLTAIQDKAEEILAAPDLATAQPLLDEFTTMGEQLMSSAAPAAYTAAQAAISYSLLPNP